MVALPIWFSDMQSEVWRSPSFIPLFLPRSNRGIYSTTRSTRTVFDKRKPKKFCNTKKDPTNLFVASNFTESRPGDLFLAIILVHCNSTFVHFWLLNWILSCKLVAEGGVQKLLTKSPKPYNIPSCVLQISGLFIMEFETLRYPVANIPIITRPGDYPDNNPPGARASPVRPRARDGWRRRLGSRQLQDGCKIQCHHQSPFYFNGCML